MSGSEGEPPETAASAGDAPWNQVLEATYRREGARLEKFLRWRLRGNEDERDLLHDAFVRLAAAGPTVSLRNPEAYLQRIVGNLLLDRRKKAANRTVHVPIDKDMHLSEPPRQADAIEVEDVKKRYRSAVEALPPRTRQVFILHRIEELPYPVIAEQLGISVGTVQWHISQAIQRIGVALER